MKNILKCTYVLLILISFVLKFTKCSFHSSQHNSHRQRRSIKKLKGTKEISWVERVKKVDAAEYLLNPLAKDLRRIGLFLAAHKYFEIDRRYTFTKTQYEESLFYKHFPIPHLGKRHPAVTKACDRGFMPCVEEINQKANISGSLAKIHRNFGKKAMGYASYHPFKDTLDLFRYRVTASYYMCWYTDLREESLAFPDTYPCFKDLEKTTEANGNRIHDFRSRVATGRGKNQRYSMFTCSYLWFCPDPCYGKTTMGAVKSKSQALKDKKNPCRGLKDKQCFWSVGKNINFEDLMRNKFNYTCNCESETKGFFWSPMYSFCIDRDECYEGKYRCPSDQICLNTVGGYLCSCRRGFYFDKATKICKRHDLLSAGAAKALKRKMTNAVGKQSPGGFLYYMKLMIDMVKGHCARPSMSKVLYILCILCLYLKIVF